MSNATVPQTTPREKRQPRRIKEVRQVVVRGVKRWQARVQYQGYRASRLCESYDTAKAAKAELLTKLKTDAEQEAKNQAAPATLAVLCDAYALDLEARGKSTDSVVRAKDTKKRLEECFKARVHEPLATLTEADLFAFRTWRVQQRCKASTINRDFRTIRAMFKWADPDFRFPRGVFFKEDETRVKWLKPEDEVLAFATVRTEVRVGPKRGMRPVPFRDMSRLAAITLMRLTEVRTLRREYVDLAQGVVTLPRTKTEPRHVVLNQEAQEILKRVLESHASEWVFPSPDNRPYSRVHVGREWRKASRAVGLTDFHFHDLRHHGATQALNAGFSGPIVQALGGWKSEKMMRRYAAVTDKTLRAAAEAASPLCQHE